MSRTSSSIPRHAGAASAGRSSAISPAAHWNRAACGWSGPCWTGMPPPSPSTAPSVPSRARAGPCNASAATPCAPSPDRRRKMAEQEFDLIVLGGGPGGYVAAIRAAQLGMKTALVEREHLGGICLNWGCIPTKALLRSSEINHLLHTLDAYGFSADNIRFDIGKIVKRSRAVANQLSGGVKHLLRKNKVTVFDGQGKLAGKGKLSVTKDGKPVAELAAKHIILATGARARVLPGIEPDGKLVWTYKEAMVPDAMPKRLIVIGSGAIGAEFASFYLNLGAEVTLVEVLDRILPVEDAEISTFVQKSFQKQGMKILTGAKVQGIRKGGNEV